MSSAIYQTSYMDDCRVAKDCMLTYRGSRYSVPFRFAGKTVLVREPVTVDASRLQRR